MKYLLIFILLSSFNVSAQVEPINNMYWNSYSYYNPAMGGVHFAHEGNVSYRSDFERNSCSPSLLINYAMNIKEKHAIGFNYVNISRGSSTNQQIKLNYNYQVDIGEDKKLVFGAALNYGRFSPYSLPFCNSLDSMTTYDNAFFLDAGIAYYGEKLTAGLGVMQIPVFLESNRTWEPQINGNIRYQINLSPEPNFLILESSFRTDLVEYSQDFNVGYNFKNIFEAGIGYRTTETILFNATGIVRENYRIGYSFAYSLNQQYGIARSMHEITLGLRFGSLKNQ
ncbi:MAG: type IX secretion system membrane protein PorP/SprF [Crocinitomicaceae bacterium]